MDPDRDIFAEADDPLGHPGIFDNLIRKWLVQGMTDEEAAELCRMPSSRGEPWPRAAWRYSLIRVAAIRRLMAVEASRMGRKPESTDVPADRVG
jgi:hypothetical protein